MKACGCTGPPGTQPWCTCFLWEKKLMALNVFFSEQDICFSPGDSGGFYYLKILIFWCFFHMKSNPIWDSLWQGQKEWRSLVSWGGWCLGPFYSLLVNDKVRLLSLTLVDVEIIVYHFPLVLLDCRTDGLEQPFPFSTHFLGGPHVSFRVSGG